MSMNRDHDHLPDDVNDVVQQLRDHRPEASALELDRMKQRARAKSLRSSRTKGHLLRSRLTAALLALGLMVAGTGGVIAANGGNGNGNSGAAKSEYKPGYGPCKNGGVNPSGTHTGPPGKPGESCATKNP